MEKRAAHGSVDKEQGVSKQTFLVGVRPEVARRPVSRTERVTSLVGSVAIHAALAVIISQTALRSASGINDQEVVWLSPSFISGNPAALVKAAEAAAVPDTSPVVPDEGETEESPVDETPPGPASQIVVQEAKKAAARAPAPPKPPAPNPPVKPVTPARPAPMPLPVPQASPVSKQVQKVAAIPLQVPTPARPPDPSAQMVKPEPEKAAQYEQKKIQEQQAREAQIGEALRMEEQAREIAGQQHREEIARLAKETERLKAEQLRQQQLARAAQEQAAQELRAKQEEARQQQEAKKAEARRLARVAAEAEERQRLERQKQAENERKLQEQRARDAQFREARRQDEQARELAEQRRREELAAQNAEQDRLKAEQLRRQQLAKAAKEQAARELRAKQEVDRQKLEAKKAAEARRLAKEAAEAEERQRLDRQRQAEKDRKLRELEPQRVAAMVKTALPVSPKKQPETEKPALVTVPQVKGDLKLVVAGETPAITMTVKAVDKKRPAASRNAKENRIIPVARTIQSNIHEYVIEKAQPGVYTISIEAGAVASQVNFSVRLYEGTARSAVKNLGARPTNKRQVLARILMPEGVLWDDESAFTGSMEDSDSITRFNTSTGLVWKEYK